MFTRFVRGLLELLAPPRCAACELVLRSTESGFCGGCCMLIAGALSGTSSERVVCTYGGPLADALHRLKYRGALEVLPALCALLEPELAELSGLVDMVTAVPMHPRRMRARGYNQSALLARFVALSLDLPFRPHALERVRGGAPQVGKGKEARARQLHLAFRARAVPQLRVLVVDDVRTTGATLAEARRALEQAGAAAVITLSLAQTPEADDSL